MNAPIETDTTRQTPQHQDFSMERISRLVADLEEELSRADLPQADDLREEIDRLKQLLASPRREEGWVRERLHSLHNGLQDVTAKVEGEVLRDSPYIAEIGRILGLV
ncbi:hypothetical protein GCM10027343_32100 [Noviherbaspirillum agri]